MHCVKKDNLFLAWLPGISAIQIEITDVITSGLLLIFLEISGKFPERLNFRKFHNLTQYNAHLRTF